MAKYFNTDGFHGETNRTLTVEHAYRIGRFLGWYYSREHDGREEEDGEQGDREQVDRGHKTYRVVIGKDTRRSSYMSEYALATGLTASGADAYLPRVTTTLSVSYVARTEGFDCGVVIPASHNSYCDNGIKLISAQGERIDEDTVLQVGAYLDGISGEIPLAVRERIGRIVDHAAGRNRYMDCFTSLTTHSYKGIKVGLDCTNGSAWMIAKGVFDTLETSTYMINNEPDRLNINTSYGSTRMESLIRLAREKELGVGFAFNGDADRCLCVDEKGNLADRDLIPYVYGRYMKEWGKLVGNKVVITATSNFGLYKALNEASIEYEKTAAGDKYVYGDMALDGYCIDDEQSGHIIFRKCTTTGDGVFTAIRMMETTLEKKQSFSRLVEPVHIYPQVLENTRVKDKQTAGGDWDVQDAVNRVEQELGTERRVLVRESGAEPVMRMVAEARDGRKYREYVDQTIRVMVDKGHQNILS